MEKLLKTHIIRNLSDFCLAFWLLKKPPVMGVHQTVAVIGILRSHANYGI